MRSDRQLLLALTCICLLTLVPCGTALAREQDQGARVLSGQTYQALLAQANAAVWSAYLARVAEPDPLYPVFHMRTSPSQWENDPAAIITLDGAYHVFGETNPFGDIWGAMSLSYVRQDPNHPYKWRYPRWRSGPLVGHFNGVTLVPTPGAGDRDGVFSGFGGVLPMAWKDDAGGEQAEFAPMIFYSGVWGAEEATQEQVFLAIGTPDEEGELTKWTKYPSNEAPRPLISQPELGLTSFRDPYIVKQDGAYYLLITGGVQREGGPHGCVLLYRSTDLLNWSRVNQGDSFFFEAPTFVKDPVTGRGDFETPVLFRLTDHAGAISGNEPWVLLVGQDGDPDAPYEKAV
jgi:sucrose-6-phosphate hydrolase SacC (GH32 family)